MDFLKQAKDELFGRSTPAVCGIMEREINVKAENVAKIKEQLKKRGMFIVGTSEPGTKIRKIWFAPSAISL